MRKQNLFLIIILLILITLIAVSCGGANVADNYNLSADNNLASNNAEPNWGNDAAGNENYMGNFAEAPSDLEGGESAGYSQSDIEDSQRIVIMNATMTISSRDPTAVVDAVSGMAENFGGFVVSSTLRQRQGLYGVEIPRADITIRVPAGRLTQAIETIKSMAEEVNFVSQTGQDVTKEYTDLQSRLRNLEEAALQLNAIMDAADETQDVLDVYEELTAVNEEAEVIRGQIQYYEQAAAMSSIELTVLQIADPTPTPTAKPTATPHPTATPQPWLPGETFDKAANDLNSAFQRWIDNMIRLFVYFLPAFVFRYLPWLAAAFFLGRWIYRRYVKPKTTQEHS